MVQMCVLSAVFHTVIKLFEVETNGGQGYYGCSFPETIFGMSSWALFLDFPLCNDNQTNPPSLPTDETPEVTWSDTYCCSLYWLRIQTAQWIGQSECTPLWNIQTMLLASRTQQLHCQWELRVYIWWNVFYICTKLTVNTMNIILQLYVHTSISTAATPICSVQQSWSPSRITQGVLNWGGNTTL